MEGVMKLMQQIAKLFKRGPSKAHKAINKYQGEKLKLEMERKRLKKEFAERQQRLEQAATAFRVGVATGRIQ
jgi:transposase